MDINQTYQLSKDYDRNEKYYKRLYKLTPRNDEKKRLERIKNRLKKKITEKVTLKKD
jgi:hypothetical protein